MVLLEQIQDLLPAGVLNVVNGFGAEAGQALATSKRIAKLAFTGSTEVGYHILKCAAESLIPSTVELGGKSPNIYFADVLEQEDDYLDKAVEGMLLAFFNQGEVCTCPSRVLIQESIYDKFIERVIARARVSNREIRWIPTLRSALKRHRSSLIKYSAIWKLAAMKAPRYCLAVRPTICRAPRVRAIMLPRQYSVAITGCGYFRRRSLAQSLL